MPVVLAPLLAPLLALLAAIVLLGLSQVSTSQHGSSNSGTFWDFITGRSYVHKLSGFAANFARWIVSHFAAGQLRMFSRWLAGMGTLTLGLFTGQVNAFEELVGAIERVYHRGDPQARRKAAGAAAAAAGATARARHANTRAGNVGHSLSTYKTRTDARLHHLTHAADVAIPHDIAGLRARNKALERARTKDASAIRELEDGAVKTWDWIRSHPFSAITGAFAGAVAIALTRLGLGAFRCNSLKNLLNKRGCGLWGDLDSIIGLLAAGLLAANLETLVHEMQDVTEESATLIKDTFHVG